MKTLLAALVLTASAVAFPPLDEDVEKWESLIAAPETKSVVTVIVTFTDIKSGESRQMMCAPVPQDESTRTYK